MPDVMTTAELVALIDAKIADMRTLTSSDIEGNHGTADALLVHTLRALAGFLGGEVEGKIKTLLESYEQVEKWYA